ncbi:hypothetical protein C8R43DRAFT_944969 [Mycena crocata]|nr:hypothetical protein C8R43DRAFT_944969 [Mycena crocata]
MIHANVQMQPPNLSRQQTSISFVQHWRHLASHYHDGMSKEYLKEVFDVFLNPSGVSQMLCATEGALTGLDVGDIVAVVDYGLPQMKPVSIQRSGRSGRRGQHAVYILMVEPWAYTASLEDVGTENADPDHPIAGHLTNYAKKAARAGLAMVLYIRCETCLHAEIQKYLADYSPDALSISMFWC